MEFDRSNSYNHTDDYYSLFFREDPHKDESDLEHLEEYYQSDIEDVKCFTNDLDDDRVPKLLEEYQNAFHAAKFHIKRDLDDLKAQKEDNMLLQEH